MSISTLPVPRPPSEGGLRVLTLNLWARSGDWAARRAVLVAGLRDMRPDLVAFQEPVKTDAYDQVADLLGPGFHVVHPTLGPVPGSDHEGAAIASRWPVGEVREVDLHLTARTADFPCTTLIAEILAPEPVGPLLFVNHLPSWQPGFEYERGLQAVAAARAIEAMLGGRDLPVVLAGDLDADPAATSIRFWSGRQALDGMSVCYRDAWEWTHPGAPGHTHLVMERDWPFHRIDYVFVRFGDHGPTLDVVDCALVFDEPVDGVWASDHFGLVADLAVPTRGTTGPA